MNGLVDTRPLRSSPAFRRTWAGTVFSATGSQVAAFAALLQVWQLTGSAVWVGAIGIARAVPMLTFGQIGGTLADTFDRRRLLLLSTSGQALAAGMLAIQAMAGNQRVWLILLLVALAASFGALGAPARRALTARLLPGDQVAAGVALNHLTFQASLLIGPVLAGVIVAGWGLAACYLIDALSFIAALYTVVRLPALRPEGLVSPPGLRAIIEGWRYVGGQRVLRGALLTDVLATVLAMPIALFPAVNEQRFGGDPHTLGLFLSAIAVGGIAAGLASGVVTHSPRPGAALLTGATVWGVALTGFGFAQTLWGTLLTLTVAGAADTVSVISRGSIVQLATPDAQRGRVSAAEHLVGVTGPELGSFRAGVVATLTSAGVAAVVGGATCVLAISLLATANKPLRRFAPQKSFPDTGPAA